MPDRNSAVSLRLLLVKNYRKVNPHWLQYQRYLVAHLIKKPRVGDQVLLGNGARPVALGTGRSPLSLCLLLGWPLLTGDLPSKRQTFHYLESTFKRKKAPPYPDVSLKKPFMVSHWFGKGIRQFPWFKYTHRSQFQGSNVMSLDTKPRRNMKKQTLTVFLPYRYTRSKMTSGA